LLAPCSGKLIQLFCKEGSALTAGQNVLVVAVEEST
jgi:hypothetical protein